MASHDDAGGADAAGAKRPRDSVDALLQTLGRSLPVGGSLRLRLVRGPRGTIAGDPVDPKAPKQAFPLVAKFPESVVPPDFATEPWRSARLYQQDVPRAPDDSDDDEEDGKNATRKKKRWRPPEAPRRQWVLQEQVDFLETMVARREKRTAGAAATDPPRQRLSSRYEGIEEHNSSHYIVLEQLPSASGSTNGSIGGEATLSCRLLPEGNSTIQFAQPAARQALSLSEAQAVMEQRQLQPGSLRLPLVPNPSAAPLQPQQLLASAKAAEANRNSSKGRLLGKLLTARSAAAGAEEEDAEDVMADVAFRSRRGGASGARRELLSALADDGVRVGEDGVLGGTNDALFAARQRFSAFSAGSDGAHASGAMNKSGGGAQERGADGAAMEEDFYQRDVQAEYEEMDFDANELFDDDDVDVGETEVKFDEGDYDVVDEEDEDEDVDEEEEVVSGVEGLASVAGFKRMLAKARGELATTPNADAGTADGERKTLESSQSVSPRSNADSPKGDETDHISKIMAAADKAAQAAKERASQATASQKASDTAAIQVDENGLRIITLEAVRKEIWLNHGSIPMKRLMKIFDIKKKSSAERQDKFRTVVKELCAMKNDPIAGRLLVLKQHYSNL